MNWTLDKSESTWSGAPGESNKEQATESNKQGSDYPEIF